MAQTVSLQCFPNVAYTSSCILFLCEYLFFFPDYFILLFGLLYVFLRQIKSYTYILSVLLSKMVLLRKERRHSDDRSEINYAMTEAIYTLPLRAVMVNEKITLCQTQNNTIYHVWVHTIISVNKCDHRLLHLCCRVGRGGQRYSRWWHSQEKVDTYAR